jgi:hypothetical protein
MLLSIEKMVLNVAVLCEESQEVTEAFTKAGHKAMSCDKYYPGAKGLPHYRGCALDLLEHEWDLIIAFPPCTYLSNVQNIHYDHIKWPEKTRRREAKREKAIEFFNRIKGAKCEKIGIENPLPSPYARKRIGMYDQIVHPYLFGDPFRKKICLWLKGLPPLVPTNIVDKGEVNHGQGKRTNAKWYHNLPPGPERAKIRSRTFSGIARAMAEQWSELLTQPTTV